MERGATKERRSEQPSASENASLVNEQAVVSIREHTRLVSTEKRKKGGRA